MEYFFKVLVKTTDALLKKDDYSTVGGDGGCRVGEGRCPSSDIYVL